MQNINHIVAFIFGNILMDIYIYLIYVIVKYYYINYYQYNKYLKMLRKDYFNNFNNKIPARQVGKSYSEYEQLMRNLTKYSLLTSEKLDNFFEALFNNPYENNKHITERLVQEHNVFEIQTPQVITEIELDGYILKTVNIINNN